ncbi:outer membrane lipoprotein chaperone LolA [Thauera sp. WB-2]|uniref:outer membrane lipoprotein chaperone LolA n=2 Tax=unclassified Thauera TaxID=2609274 RepID=UPI0022DDEEB8|nr:outer membrane lipoprotein chaperone LolA [Thauera sp. WB-2]WBL62905.1 outer membrane lipoprotein chaperone LolA [Thauera sp. WB-2]HRK09548.1 outer membrane lipoprotein chaperone LolA [Thauera sp.]
MRFSGLRVGALGRGASMIVLLTTAALAQAADGVAQLRSFVAEVRSAEGEFEQVVSARSGRRPQQAAGSFAYARPGKFHWEYVQPYRQVLVGDGSALWTWDPDLNQVTVRAIGDALGATPAAILFGSGELDDSFELGDGGVHDGVAWVDARPLRSDSGFEALRIGMADGQLREMEMRDNFGQTTSIRFTRLRTNPVLADDRFRFSVPAGADLIGEAPAEAAGRQGAALR